MIFILFVTCYLIMIVSFIKTWGKNDHIGLIFATFFYGAIMAVIMVLIADVTKFSHEDGRQDLSCAIFSMSNKDVINGRFDLGSGYVNSREAYFYFVKDNRGAYLRNWVYAQNVCIFQRDGVQPQMKWQQVYYTFPRWFIPWKQVSAKLDTKYDFYVPTETVIESFKVN